MKRYGMIGVNGKKIPINAMIRNVFWNKWKRGFKVNYGEIKNVILQMERVFVLPFSCQAAGIIVRDVLTV